MKKKCKLFFIFFTIIFVLFTVKVTALEDCELEHIVSDPSIYKVITELDDDGCMYNESCRTKGGKYIVNSYFAQLYCRETLTYEFYDEVYAKAGRYFYYDILNNNSMLTAKFNGKKDCAVVIDYNKWFNYYEQLNSQVASSWTELKEWSAALSSVPSNGQEATISNVASATLNTHFVQDTCDAKSTRGCRISGQSHKGNSLFYKTWNWNGRGYPTASYSKALSVSSSSTSRFLYGDYYATSTIGTDKKCDCMVSNYAQSSEQTETWAKGFIVSGYNAALAAYKEALSDRENWIIRLIEANVYGGSGMAVDYISEIQNSTDDGIEISHSDVSDIKNAIGGNYGSGRKEMLYCSSGDGKEYTNQIEYGDENRHDKEYGNTPILESKVNNHGAGSTKFCNSGNENYVEKKPCSPSATTSDAYMTVNYVNCSSKTCQTNKRKVPINYTAYFTASADIKIQQVETYYNHVYSGIVTTGSAISGVASYEFTEHIYPVSLQTPSGIYDVNMLYGCIGDIGINRTDQLAGVNPETGKYENRSTKFSRDSEYTCYLHVDNETTIYDTDIDSDTCTYNKDGSCISKNPSLGFVYRTIDLMDVFPNDRTPGRNWQNSVNIISAIENLGNDIWFKVEPEYSFTLTPENRANIREYNHQQEGSKYGLILSGGNTTGTGYLSNTLSGCTVTSEGKFENCQSSFLLTGEANDYFKGGKVE